MFGYIRPFKPYLRVCEYEAYRSVYCGVCKSIGRQCGQLPRLALSYDLAALALLDMSVNSIRLEVRQERCPAHPLVKRSCAVNGGLGYSAGASVLLLYHKLRDDSTDGRGARQLAASAAVPFIAEAFIGARERYPALAARIDRQMKEQSALEREHCASLDRAAEPTARIMQAVTAGISDDREMSRRLGSFGYFLGRFIYLTDALDDLREDARRGRYNPLLERYALKEVSDDDFGRIAEDTSFSVNMTLGLLADAYCRLELGMYRTIFDNIVYLGLKNVFDQVRNGTFHKKDKPTARL